MGWHPSQMRTGALTRAPPKLRQVLTKTAVTARISTLLTKPLPGAPFTQSRQAPCLTHTTPAVHTARKSTTKRSPGRALHGHPLWQLLPEFRSRTATRCSARTSEFILNFFPHFFFFLCLTFLQGKKDYIFLKNYCYQCSHASEHSGSGWYE
jgi:hypothetical protein